CAIVLVRHGYMRTFDFSRDFGVPNGDAKTLRNSFRKGLRRSHEEPEAQAGLGRVSKLALGLHRVCPPWRLDRIDVRLPGWPTISKNTRTTGRKKQAAIQPPPIGKRNRSSARGLTLRWR